MKKPDTTITIEVQNTPSGRLLQRAIQIINEKGCTMGAAMSQVQEELEAENLELRRSLSSAMVRSDTKSS